MAKNRGYSIPWYVLSTPTRCRIDYSLRDASRNFNPFLVGASIMDCGDVPISPYDNSLALDQMETAYSTLLAREVDTEFTRGASAKRGREAESVRIPATDSLVT